MLSGRCLCGTIRYAIDGGIGPIAFCRCGSPMYSRTAAEPDILRIRLGTLDQDPGGRPRLHVWTSEQAAWFAILDDLPQIAAVARKA